MTSPSRGPTPGWLPYRRVGVRRWLHRRHGCGHHIGREPTAVGAAATVLVPAVAVMQSAALGAPGASRLMHGPQAVGAGRALAGRAAHIRPPLSRSRGRPDFDESRSACPDARPAERARSRSSQGDLPRSLVQRSKVITALCSGQGLDRDRRVMSCRADHTRSPGIGRARAPMVRM